MKRGTKVSVHFEGTVVNNIRGGDGIKSTLGDESVDGVRVSVKGMKPSWWAVVPIRTAKPVAEDPVHSLVRAAWEACAYGSEPPYHHEDCMMLVEEPEEDGECECGMDNLREALAPWHDEFVAMMKKGTRR